MLSAHSSCPLPVQAELRAPWGTSPSVGKALIAALPPALFGLGLSIAPLMATGSSNLVVGGTTAYPWVPSGACPVGTGLMLGVPVLVLLGRALVGTWKRLPLWSHV